jgi:hypothetical protein
VSLGLLAVANAVGFLFVHRRHPPDGAPQPPLVRWSFLAFGTILLAVGLALLTGAEGVMPWPLDDRMSVVIGWIFFGDAFYFLYGAIRGTWSSARAPLWSFLAYDLVLLGPLVAHYWDAPSDLRLNVAVYVAVLVYSAVLASWYLVWNRRTRGW